MCVVVQWRWTASLMSICRPNTHKMVLPKTSDIVCCDRQKCGPESLSASMAESRTKYWNHHRMSAAVTLAHLLLMLPFSTARISQITHMYIYICLEVLTLTFFVKWETPVKRFMTHTNKIMQTRNYTRSQQTAQIKIIYKHQHNISNIFLQVKTQVPSPFSSKIKAMHRPTNNVTVFFLWQSSQSPHLWLLGATGWGYMNSCLSWIRL